MITNNVIGSDFGINCLDKITKDISEKRKRKIEELYNQRNGFDLMSQLDNQKIVDMFNSSLWSTEKLKTWDSLVENGRLEEFGLSKADSPYYSNMENIKKPGLMWKMTSEEYSEYKKCANDIVYFANNYIKLKDDEGNFKKVTIRDYQNTILDNFQTHRNNILMCSRQIGKTVTTAIFILWYATFNELKNIMLLANKRETTREIIDKLKNIYKFIPMWLKPGVLIWNVDSMKFDTDTRILTQACTKNPAIGFSIDVLYVDEFAHITPNLLEDFWKHVFPVVSASKTSKIIITSTPNGLNKFYYLWTDAIAGNNTFHPTRVDWWQVPGRDEEWKQKTISDMGQKEFDQEFGLRFVMNENALVDDDLMKFTNRIAVEYINKYLPDIDIERHCDYYWHPKFDPSELNKPNNKFVLCFDFSGGCGLDYNVVSIFQLKLNSDAKRKIMNKKNDSIFNSVRFELVGYYSNNTSNIFDFNYSIANDISKLFNEKNIKISLECNDNRYIGFVKDFQDIIKNKNKNKRVKDFYDSNDINIIFLKTFHSEKSKIRKTGYILNKNNRNEWLKNLTKMMKDHTIVIQSIKYLEQLQFFVLDNKSFVYKCQAPNDDLIMSVLGLQTFFIDSYNHTFLINFLSNNRINAVNVHRSMLEMITMLQ